MQLRFAVTLLSVAAAYPALAWQHATVNGGFDSGVAITLDSEAPIKTWLSSTRPEISIHCKKKTVRLWLNVGAPLAYSGRFHYGRIRYRTDGGSVVSEFWGEATQSGVYSAPNTKALIAKLQRAKLLEIEVVPHNASAVTAKFAVDGLESAYANMMKRCK